MADTIDMACFVAGAFSGLGRLRRSRSGSVAIGAAVAAPTMLAASFAGALALSWSGGAGPVAQAAARATELVSLQSRLYDSDFNQTLFPVTQGVAGKDAAGRPLACGIVITGLEPAAADGTRAVRWQRRYGRCPVTRLTPAAVLDEPAAVPVVMVEVAGHPARGDAYAASVAVPQKLALPVVMAGSRF